MKRHRVEELNDVTITSETENSPPYGMSEESASVITEIRAAKMNARTPLGRKLWEIGERIVASGQPLLGWEDIEREIAERRGGAG